MTVVTIVEPYFLPWLGYIHRLLTADKIVVLDHVKYPKQTYVNRVQVNQQNGPTWISVPVKGANENLLIKDTYISDEKRWKNKIINIIRYNYCTCEYYDHYYNEIFNMINSPFSNLLEYNMNVIYSLCQLLDFDIKAKVYFSSQFIDLGAKNDLNINLVKKLEGTVYYSGTVAKNYNDHNAFTEERLLLLYHNWKEPDYEHRWGVNVKGMSAIDSLFHIGKDRLREYILRERENELQRIEIESQKFFEDKKWI